MNADVQPTGPTFGVRDALSDPARERVELSGPSDDSIDPVVGESWPEIDIEEAYLKALDAMDDLPWEDPQPAMIQEAASELIGETAGVLPRVVGAAPQGAASAPPENDLAPTALIPSAEIPAVPMATDSGPRLVPGTAREADTPEERLNVTPAQVIEAALFVGGVLLTAKKLSGLLRGSLDAPAIERLIDDLNGKYDEEARPYEIRLREGGYRLELRSEYDRLKHRVFGSGPREVRLSQEVIEVLALVAYRQPMSVEELEGHGKENAGNVLRQLLRRDLVSIERGSGGRKDIRYRTTPRFLSVFGLGKISELPQVDDLALK